jgi:hypothetical protein
MVEGGRKEKPSAALARTRPVFRGLRRKSRRRGSALKKTLSCKDETRFQGIATQKKGVHPLAKDETRFQGRLMP